MIVFRHILAAEPADRIVAALQHRLDRAQPLHILQVPLIAPDGLWWARAVASASRARSGSPRSIQTAASSDSHSPEWPQRRVPSCSR